MIGCGGIPACKVTEISGEEATGKTLLACQVVANTQKMGGVAVYLDYEHALRRDFMERLGVDVDKVIRPDVQTMEDGFKVIEKIMVLARQTIPNKDKPVLVVWDSIAQAPCQQEIEGSFDPSDYMGIRARTLGLALRKLTQNVDDFYVTLLLLNQVRKDFNVKNPYMDPFVTPGGKALPFACSLRVRLHSGSKIKNENKDVIGISTKAKITKNRMSLPFRETSFPIMFGTSYECGVDNCQSIYNYLHESEKITKSGGNTTLKLLDKEESFAHNEWPNFYNANKEAIFKLLDSLLIKKFDKTEQIIVTEEALEE